MNHRKPLFTFLSILIIFQCAQAAEGEKEVNSTIQTVKVFRQGAQVLRVGKTAIPEGQTILKFTNLSPDLDSKSIQFKADGDFTILSVNHQLNYLKETEQSLAYKKLWTDRDALQDKLEREQVKIQVLTEEENLLLANKDVGGNTGASVEKIKAMSAYYRTRLSEIKLTKLDINAVIKAIQADFVKNQNQIKELNTRNNKATSEILVKILAKTSTQGAFELSYFVRNAGWYPTYDIRVKDIQNPVELAYKANVFQNSGEDWTQVQLSLSTGNPSHLSINPELAPWWVSLESTIRYVVPEPKKDEEVVNEELPPPIEQLQDIEISNTTQEDGIEDIPKVAFKDGAIAVEFLIEIPYDIPADGKQYAVEIKNYSIPAYYEYHSVPKVDLRAYLIAQLTNWEQYNLLNGEANLYFEGTFLGKSYLNTSNVKDTFTLSLGRDENIIITRIQENQFTDNQFLGNKKTETYGWNIELRNKKKQPINIVLEDQYPLSTNEAIEVTLDNTNGAAINKEEGKLKWKLALDAGKAEKLNFRYSVKYPKKQRLMLE